MLSSYCIRESYSMHYYRHGLVHRVGGPAVIWEGDLYSKDGNTYYRSKGYWCYYEYGLMHRSDGPAISYPNGRVKYVIRGEENHELGRFTLFRGHDHSAVDIDCGSID